MITTLENKLTPRIYVTCLAAYNAGHLHGTWVDVDNLDTLNEAIQTMLAASPEPGAEEWAIHDYEGFGSLRLSEYEGLESVVAKAEFIQEHGELGALVLDHFAGNMDEARQALEESYAGCFESLGDFAEQFTEETGGLAPVPDTLRPYIDFDAMGRDWDLNGDVFTLETASREIHVFWNR